MSFSFMYLNGTAQKEMERDGIVTDIKAYCNIPNQA